MNFDLRWPNCFYVYLSEFSSAEPNFKRVLYFTFKKVGKNNYILKNELFYELLELIKKIIIMNLQI